MAKEENIYSKYNTHEHGLSDAEAQKTTWRKWQKYIPCWKTKKCTTDTFEPI